MTKPAITTLPDADIAKAQRGDVVFLTTTADLDGPTQMQLAALIDKVYDRTGVTLLLLDKSMQVVRIQKAHPCPESTTTNEAAAQPEDTDQHGARPE